MVSFSITYALGQHNNDMTIQIFFKHLVMDFFAHLKFFRMIPASECLATSFVIAN